MIKMTTEDILNSRLKTLENDFQQRFGEKDEAISFINSLKKLSDKNGTLQEIELKGRFGRLLKVIEKRFSNVLKELSGDKSSNSDKKLLSALIKVMALERILSADSMRGRGKGSLDDTFLDAQMFESVDAAFSYAKTAKSFELENVERESLGWGFGGNGKGTFSKDSFYLVQKYSKILEKSQKLSELAEKIGRHSKTKSDRIKADGNKPSVSYDGIYNSDNIRTILPSELALSTDPRTRTEFLRRLADRQVLCYKPAPDKSAADGNDKDKGPVIICLDTSGSMHGLPEAISKAMTLGIVKIAAKEKRKVLIISFSVTFETFVINKIEKTSEMSKFIDFLSSSFHGGTDIASAIDHALSLTKGGLASADVLIISDFVSQPLSNNTVKTIELAKRKGTRFFALSMGNRGNNQILKLMNETEIVSKNWESINLEF